MKSSLGFRLVVMLGLGAIGTAFLGGLILIVANTIALPRIIPGIEKSLERACGCQVSFVNVRYFPGRGITVGSIGVQKSCAGCLIEEDGNSIKDSTSGFTLGIDKSRFPLSRRFVRALRRGLKISIPRVDPIDINSAIFDILEPVVRSGIVPRFINLGVTTFAFAGPDRPSTLLSFDQAQMTHDADHDTVVVSADSISPAAAYVSAQLDYGSREVSVDLDISSLSIETILMQLANRRDSFLTSGAISGKISLASDAREPVRFGGAIDLGDLEIVHPSIADAPIALDIGIAFNGNYDFDAPFIDRGDGSRIGELIFTDGKITSGGVEIFLLPSFKGMFTKTSPILPNDDSDRNRISGSSLSPAIVEVVVQIPMTPVDRLLANIPDAIAGPVSKIATTGSVAWQLDLRIPLEEASRMEWDSSVELEDFGVTEIPSTINPYNLNESFVLAIDHIGSAYQRTVSIPVMRRASDAWWLLHSEHTQAQIDDSRAEDARILANRPDVSVNLHSNETPDPAYRYIYLDEMSPWVIRTILTAEDGDFFFYGGVNPVTLADAIEINLEAGEILFGASTITMQLAKMLFLDQDRTFARKMQEVFLVYLIEHQVPVAKDRIIELYLNITEFGPGIIGIFDAAEYYFEKHPEDLSAGEAAWLASILPAPKIYHRYFEEGSIPDEWFSKMIALYDIMLERGRMTRGEYDSAIGRRPEFRVTDPPVPAISRIQLSSTKIVVTESRVRSRILRTPYLRSPIS